MRALDLKKSLTLQFNRILEDESNLSLLSGVFDAINTTEYSSSVSNKQYDIVAERRAKYNTGESEGTNWDVMKIDLKKKYDF